MTSDRKDARYLIRGVDLAISRSDSLREIGSAGLVCRLQRVLESGTPVRLSISVVQPVLQCDGHVVWCRPEDDHFVAGVKFLHRVDPFRARMIWQVCCVEQYRRTVREREGRTLTQQEAAAEWIGRFAADFPKLEEFPES